ncbi:MAG: extracellular solute-binding protein [Lachnospiraceae bacterium]|nr:extracellular solute-binding protein [Lachnospiraceae bacterium]
MSLKKRLAAVGVIAAVAVITFGIASGRQMMQTQEEEVAPVSYGGKETLYVWYTDEALTSYISSAAVTYNEDHDIRVVPVLEPGIEYLEQINQASLLEENIPDAYILSHDSLEKAYLAGLAHEIAPKEDISLEESYMQTSLDAVTYKDKVIGYPFYFETGSLLYNRTYLEELAKSQLQVEALLQEEGTEEEAGAEQSIEEAVIDEEEIRKRVEELLPETLEEIKAFADSYDTPEQVEAVFKWDVTDIFYNYFFIGNAIQMGGEAGWDASRIDIYNEDAIESMRAYEELKQFFSIDASEVDYDTVIDEFAAGKLIFTVATTDVVARLEQAKEDGLFEYDYGISLTPDIDENRKTRSLSMTQCVVINGYSEHQKEANDFAYFLTCEYNDILYARTGKVSAAKNVDYGYDALYRFAEEYEKSISMPKMIETSNFWVQLEVAFSQVWNGADANLMLKELSEQIMQQVTGQPYTEEYIEEIREEEEVEYLDEDYYTQEAMEEE